jgi:U6 snRNA-associated Sm-like protein LSm2
MYLLNYLMQACLTNCFIRGSTVRYIHLPANDVDTDVLQDATRKEHQASKK